MLMRLLKLIGGVLLAGVIAIGALFLGARFMDGPLGPIPGGALSSGPLAAERVADWNFAADIDTIEMQLVSDGRSRTVWILVHEGRGFIPCAIGAPPGKTWHQSAEQDGRSLIRIEGTRYEVALTRVHDAKLQQTLSQVTLDKYPGPPGEGGESWYFSLMSR